MQVPSSIIRRSIPCRWGSALAVGLIFLSSGCSRDERDRVPNPAGSSEIPGAVLLARTHANEQSLNMDNVPMAGMQSAPPVPSTFQPDVNDRRPPLLALRFRDSTVAGVPIGLFTDKTLLMREDGAIQAFQNNTIVEKTILNQRFQAIDRKSLTSQLYSEFGKRYTVKQEGHYQIVASPEQVTAWAKRFRSIQHSVNLYCATRNLPMRDIEFPLVAVVFGTRQEFQRYASNEGAQLPQNCVGYYSQNSNRIVLFESPTGIAQETLETICHEASHQLAFNIGLHQRMAGTPLWLAEGFATMFESPALSGLPSRDGGSLWPSSRRSEWLHLAKTPDQIHRMIEGLIKNDNLFQSDGQKAYCLSWAMAIYLSQRHSEHFGRYVATVATLPPFEDYDANQRVSDFKRTFGLDARLLSKNVMAYLSSLE